MTRRLLGWIVRLYPPWWRDRYGAEFDALVDDVAGEGTRRGVRLAANLLAGALRERTRTRAWAPPVPAAGPPIPFFGSYPFLYRDRLGRRAPARIPPHLLAGEVPLATMRAVSRLPRSRRFVAVLAEGSIAGGTALLGADLAAHDSRQLVGILTPLAVEVVMALTGAAVLRAAGSFTRILVVTPSGVTLLSVDWLGRAKAVVERVPAVQPRLVDRRGRWERVRLGHSTFWARGPDERRLLGLMESYGRPAGPAA